MKSPVVAALEAEKKRLSSELARVERALASFGVVTKGAKRRKNPGPKPGTKRAPVAKIANPPKARAIRGPKEKSAKPAAKAPTTPPAPVRSKGGLSALAARTRAAAAESES